MSLKSRLAADETLCTAWSGVPDALTVEILARQGFDAVTLDMQHGGHHEDSVLRGLGPVLAANKPALVRIPVGRFDMASRALDFGAEAVIAPMVNSVADARLFAAAMKYPPLGERSWGPTYAFPRHGRGDYADWLRDSNERTMAFAMVETRAALDALDGILDTPGIDGIFLGPSDFSIAWSNGATVNSTLESMLETVASIAERTRKAGKYAAIYVVEPGIAGRVVSMGYRLLAMGSEHALIGLGAKTLLKSVRDSIGP
ncbi:MAG: 2,4-dihydroxyhept-2-ene-1,7-dioic acid aldolase [Mesorhizobium sp.]|uniref:HpcH/HpaI aldolase family protein n=1 Tax=unclassified Mesorhizobium TaxID=325217 RepID=UPI000FCCACBB|nr:MULTISPECIES: HpcH/HpaI aldolase/citrate lyase family protein [unclassified Mesorhizobium]RUV20557.1 2,4-dihydroxyhept-2-ene-1,7-dioic acid aldolase [Mesorhizobium sp. M5C.F.Ca.IN.020.32.2.1]RUV61355.1 2,4-dihydroxyhept-2-ene-1,7-dioic acid aldolase [Mesorhizobium sp. M5C.F.Ca.IN.020.29.1.1]RWC42719.1 MAG: 2,4-dihydroxyhept-2-ene-1,7-dioic acid aldolase [Mesorhizobium sp.]RWD48568.1 MAG: 2,4-dihydroxyhept-2-ene-1,7-dioic acid aldolase [Mesorhizobium sp.]RWE08054.1 MAG: 2,4-dihydroxyhept-2-e